MAGKLYHIAYINWMEEMDARGHRPGPTPPPAPSALIPAGTTFTWPSVRAVSRKVEQADGSYDEYGIDTSMGELLTLHIQEGATPKFIFGLPMQRDQSGKWEPTAADEGDLLGIAWTTVKDIDGKSHDFAIQGSSTIRVDTLDGWWAVVRLCDTAENSQYAQVVEFDPAVRPLMADFIDSCGIQPERMDEMLASGVPVSDTGMAEAYLVEPPIRHEAEE